MSHQNLAQQVPQAQPDQKLGTCVHNRPMHNKYRNIILSLILYTIITVAMLLVGYNRSVSLSQYIAQADAVHELSEEVAQSIMQTQSMVLAHDHNKDKNGSSKEWVLKFDKTEQHVEQLVRLLQVGGSAETEHTHYSNVRPLEKGAMNDDLKNFTQAWSDHMRILSDWNDKVSTHHHMQQHEAFLQQIREHQQLFSDSLGNMSLHLHLQRAESAMLARILQILAVLVSLAYLLLVVPFLVRQMQRSDRRIALANQETQDILDTVSDGLFLLDSQLNIGCNHSQALSQIFEDDKIGGKHFLIYIKDLLGNDKKYQLVEMFVEQLFRASVAEQMLYQLNPLFDVEVNLKHSKTPKRLLSFKFTRIYEDNKISKILVRVKDRTESDNLARQLKKEQECNNDQLRMFGIVLDDSQDSKQLEQLSDFLNHAIHYLLNINKILKSSLNAPEDMKYKAQAITDEAKNLYDLAVEQNMPLVATLADGLKDKAVQLAEKPNLVGEDFLPLVLKLEKLLRIMALMQALISKVSMPILQITEDMQNIADEQYYSEKPTE